MEVGDVAVLVADGEVEVDEIDGDLEGLSVEAFDFLRFRVALGRGAIGGWGFLGEEGVGQDEGEG